MRSQGSDGLLERNGEWVDRRVEGDRKIVLPQSEREFAFAGVSGNTLAEDHS